MSLDAKSISVRLAGRPILRDVDCRAERGRITAVIGPNGAGKSTLLRALAGLLPIEQGSVSIEGRNLAAIERLELARALAYLPQDRAVHWPLSVRAIVGLGRLPHRGRDRALRSGMSAVDAAMRVMDVTDLAARPVSELSGGERARVMVARALAQESGILIADEPTAGLDPAHALELFSTFQRLATDGRVVLIALHDLTLAARFCHHVVLLVDGRVAAAGPAAAVMTPEGLSAAFRVRFACDMLDGVPVVLPISAA
jgi:iron complex transport system ATP-binding protein